MCVTVALGCGTVTFECNLFTVIYAGVAIMYAYVTAIYAGVAIMYVYVTVIYGDVTVMYADVTVYGVNPVQYCDDCVIAPLWSMHCSLRRACIGCFHCDDC